MILLLACTSETVPEREDSAAAEPDAVEELPEVEVPVRELEAPGVAALSCTETIPETGKVACAASFAWPDGEPAWSGTAGVGLHGRSSMGFPKPQYAVELRDETGADEKVELFGLAAEADWLLNGMYIDRALMRNRLAYDLFRSLGGWAPRTAYVELTVNGSPMGVYLLTERVERGDGRLAYAEDDGTGARFIVKADETGIASTLQYGSWAILDPEPATSAQEAGVAAALGELEGAISAADPALWDLAELESFVAFVLVEELLKNNDAYYLSHHLWRGDDALFRLVPWDLDLTLGQPYYNENWRSDSWIAYRADFVAGLGDLPAFRARLGATWTDARAGELATDAVLARMAGYRALVGEDAIARNFDLWPIGSIQFAGSELYPVSSYDEEYALVTTWITERLAWMDQNLADW